MRRSHAFLTSRGRPPNDVPPCILSAALQFLGLARYRVFLPISILSPLSLSLNRFSHLTLRHTRDPSHFPQCPFPPSSTPLSSLGINTSHSFCHDYHRTRRSAQIHMSASESPRHSLLSLVCTCFVNWHCGSENRATDHFGIP